MKSLAVITLAFLSILLINNSVLADNDNQISGSKSTSKVAGYVIDKNTGEILTGVKIQTEGLEQSVYTNINGYFEIEIPADSKELTTDFVSYKSVTVKTGQPFVQIELESKDVIE